MKNPDILAELRKELDDALGSEYDKIPVHWKLEHLKYFNCIIKEGLRIDTAVPGSTPRYVHLETPASMARNSLEAQSSQSKPIQCIETLPGFLILTSSALSVG